MSVKSCKNCKKSIGKFATKCRYCYSEQAVEMQPKDIIVSSTASIEGYEIIDQCGFVFGEVVCPNGIFGAITNRTFFTISALTDARSKAMADLIAKARTLGANALIGIDIDISDLNGNGILVSANATAVVVIPKDAQKFENGSITDDTKLAELEENAKKEVQIEIDKLDKQLKEIAIEVSDLCELDKMLIKMFTKHSSLDAKTIMRSTPKNIPYSEISTSLNKLVESGVIERDSEGSYYSRIKSDNEDNIIIR